MPFLVEVDELNCNVPSRRLARKGYDVIAAADGDKGVRMAVGKSPDFVLMHIDLCSIDGFDSMRRVSTEVTANGTHFAALARVGKADILPVRWVS